MTEDGGEGWRPWRLIPRVAAGAVSLPVVVGFVALGAAVVVARSVRDVVRDGWALLPSRRARSGSGAQSKSDAA
jgi:hypothetical protein